MTLPTLLPPQRTTIDLEKAAAKTERQLIKRYRVIRARSLAKRQQEPMPWTHDNSAGIHFTVPQGSARVRTLAIEDVNMPIDFSNTHNAP